MAETSRGAHLARFLHGDRRALPPPARIPRRLLSFRTRVASGLLCGGHGAREAEGLIQGLGPSARRTIGIAQSEGCRRA